VTHVTATAGAAVTSHAPGLPSRKLAVWLFLGSEVLFFAALMLTTVALRLTSQSWPAHEQVQRVLNIPLTALNTFLLIVSSVTVVLALDAVQRGRQRRLIAYLLATLALGTTFLGIQAYEYHLLWGHGLTPTAVPRVEMAGADPLFASTFYAMTGFHGLHVLGGLLVLLLVIGRALGGAYSSGSHEGVELFGLYWHFVDVVWIVLFTLAYLI
jgi:cytochrome c oxidase subunit III